MLKLMAFLKLARRNGNSNDLKKEIIRSLMP